MVHLQRTRVPVLASQTLAHVNSVDFWMLSKFTSCQSGYVKPLERVSRLGCCVGGRAKCSDQGAINHHMGTEEVENGTIIIAYHMLYSCKSILRCVFCARGFRVTLCSDGIQRASQHTWPPALLVRIMLVSNYVHGQRMEPSGLHI